MLRLCLALLVLFVAFVGALGSTSVDSKNFNVTFGINSNHNPTITFQQTSNTSALYRVTLVELWEAVNGSSLDRYASLAPMTSWESKDGGLNANGTVHYWVIEAQVGKGFNYDTFVLNFSVPLGAVNSNSTTSYEATDYTVSISNYRWMAPQDQNPSLVFSYELEYLKMSDSVYSPQATVLNLKSSRNVNFDEAYFAINTTFKSGMNLNETSSVYITTAVEIQPNATNKQIIYVVYDTFDTNLMHDPQVGFGSGPGQSLIWVIILVVVIIAIVVIILIAVIGFVLVRRRRRSYDSF